MLACASLVALVSTAAPAHGTLTELVTHLDLKHCDDAFALVSQVEVPKPPDPELAHAARAVVRGAERCKGDPAIGLAFTGLAVKLSPDDPTVLLEHAALLVAVKHRAEASEVLDRVIARHPDSYPRARLLRGQVAAEEADHELAVRLLEPLSSDPKLMAEAEPLLVRSRAELQQRQAAQGELTRLETQADDPAARPAKKGRKGKREPDDPPVSRALDQPAPDAGRLVANLSGKISLGGERTFTVKGLEKGRNYTFKASGECSRKAAKAGKKKKKAVFTEDPNRSIFGIDFAVQFGQQDPRVLSAGQGEPDLNEIPFTADASSMPVRVFDRSSVEKGVSCTFTGFSVVVR